MSALGLVEASIGFGDSIWFNDASWAWYGKVLAAAATSTFAAAWDKLWWHVYAHVLNLSRSHLERCKDKCKDKLVNLHKKNWYHHLWRAIYSVQSTVRYHIRVHHRVEEHKSKAPSILCNLYPFRPRTKQWMSKSPCAASMPEKSAWSNPISHVHTLLWNSMAWLRSGKAPYSTVREGNRVTDRSAVWQSQTLGQCPLSAKLRMSQPSRQQKLGGKIGTAFPKQ